MNDTLPPDNAGGQPEEDGNGPLSYEFPPVVYHYCPSAAFLNILRSKCMFLSDIRHMNDYKEGTWAYEVVDQIISAKTKPSGERHWGELGVKLLNLWHLNRLQLPPRVSSFGPQNDLAAALTRSHVAAFIACFSRGDDVLSQWRAYAEDGRGVAIGFDPATLGLEARPAYGSRDSRSATGFARVVYDKDKQTRMISDRLDQYLLHVKANPENAERAAGSCVADLLAISLTLKNPAFREEQEWRIIHTPLWTGKTINDLEGVLTDVQYRVSGGNVVAYVPFPLAVGYAPVVKEIVLGPRNESAWATVKGLLERCGYPDADVRKSKASYR